MLETLQRTIATEIIIKRSKVIHISCSKGKHPKCGHVVLNSLITHLENTPMGDELKWLLTEGGGHIFESCELV